MLQIFTGMMRGFFFPSVYGAHVSRALVFESCAVRLIARRPLWPQVIDQHNFWSQKSWKMELKKMETVIKKIPAQLLSSRLSFPFDKTSVHLTFSVVSPSSKRSP